MKIAIGSDHGGITLKSHLIKTLETAGHEVLDKGCFSKESCDYPDFGRAVAEAVQLGQAERGVLICGTGIGMSLVANKFKGIRAALCTNEYMSKMARAHNNSNVLVVGERVIGPGLADGILEAFMSTDFEGGRHQRRVDMIE